MNEPYVRLLHHPVTVADSGPFKPFKVWLVDGPWIRKQSQEANEFTNFGEHYRFNFIPMYEFWIDFFDTNRSTQGFFILHMIAEWQAMHAGNSYSVAYNRALRVVARAEKKYEKPAPDVDPEDAVLRTFHILDDLMVIKLVDETFIYKHLSLNFAEGGHHSVPGYGFIGYNDFWIGGSLPGQEKLIICGHEIGEERLMRLKRMKYEDAHNQISKKELEVRDNPAELMPWLDSLGW